MMKVAMFMMALMGNNLREFLTIGMEIKVALQNFHKIEMHSITHIPTIMT